jgi:hypothetical protein
LPLPTIRKNNVLNNLLRAVAMPAAPTAWFVALCRSEPAADGSGGTEVLTTTGYARQAVTFADPATGTVGETNNTAVIQFPTLTADGGVASHFKIMDAATAGNVVFFDNLRDAAGAAITRALSTGTAPSFDIGELRIDANRVSL